MPGCLGQTKWYASTVIGILKQEKHMGDALLQKTYTADFLTKRQVKNNGEVAQVYVRDSHKGIVDKETWNAVQEEFERREKFMQKHGTDRYSYGSECYPFCEKIFCGECGSLLQDIPGNQEESYNGSARITVRMEKLHAPMPM